MAKRVPPGSSHPPSEIRNHLLAALPAQDFGRLFPKMKIMPLELRHMISEPGDRIKFVYFPTDGFFSELTRLRSGEMVEVVTIGREGVSGGPAALDGDPVTSATMVQAEMQACYRLTVADFRAEMADVGLFSVLINRYLKALMGMVMQSTACNAVHPLEQRLARWLLLAHDRLETDEFPLTQEFVSMMLAVTRPTVSVVAGALQKAGLITYRRGRITIADRAGLEKASCECYASATRLLKNVVRGLGPDHRAR